MIVSLKKYIFSPIAKALRILFWDYFYYPLIIIKVSIYKYLLGADAFSSILQKIPYPPLLARFLKRFGASIGNNSIIQRGLYIHCPQGRKKPFKNLTLGEKSYIDKFVLIDLTNTVKIGNCTRISCGVKIYSHVGNYERGINTVSMNSSAVKIGNNCRLFPNVTITSGVIIKDNVLVGAGSVVIDKILENNSLYGGVPAKLKSKF